MFRADNRMDMNQQSNLLKDAYARFMTPQQPSIADVMNASFASSAAAARVGGDPLGAYTQSMDSANQRVQTQNINNLEAQKGVYDILKQQADEGDAKSRQIMETVGMFADNPEDMARVIERLHQKGEQTGVDYSQVDPLPDIIQIFKELGIRPGASARAEAELQRRDRELRGEQIDVERSANEVRRMEIQQKGLMGGSPKMGRLPTGTWLNPETGMVEKIPGTEAVMQEMNANKGKALPVAYTNKLNSAADTIQSMDRLVNNYKPEYSGAPVADRVENFLAKYAPILVESNSVDQADWWQDYQNVTNIERHELFGAALTDTERAEWDKANISPGMNPEIVKLNLQRRKDIATKVLKRIADTSQAGGYNKAQIDEWRKMANPSGAQESASPAASTGGTTREVWGRDENNRPVPKKKDNPVSGQSGTNEVQGNAGRDFLDTTLGFIADDLEGGAKVVKDVNGALVKYGVNQAHNKEVDVRSISRDQAIELYKKKYPIEKYIRGDESPQFKAVVQDTIIQHGPRAAKRMIKAANGDPYALLNQRRDYYRYLAKINPEKYSPTLKGVLNRYEKLENFIDGGFNA